MKLSIIIPFYNSPKVIDVIESINKLSLKGTEKEIIVVDDASVHPIAKELVTLKGILYIRHSKNIGKGGAVATGFSHATGDILYIQDDDFEYLPKDIPVVIAPIISGKSNVVFGSRRLNKENNYSSTMYYLGGVLLDWLTSIFLSTILTDAITGSKAFSREVYEKMKPIESKGFEIEAELCIKPIKLGYRPYEVPITYHPRTHEEGKNIRWHHAFPIIKTLLLSPFKK